MPEGLQFTFMELPELQREPYNLVRGNKTLKIQPPLVRTSSGGQKVVRTTPAQPKIPSVTNKDKILTPFSKYCLGERKIGGNLDQAF